MKATQAPWGSKDGKAITQYTIANTNGLAISAVNYGGTLTRVMVPDRRGAVKNVVLGFDTLDDYIARSPYFGALVGRFANRIAKGRFRIDGVDYQLACNDIYGAGGRDVANHLHGGNVGYDKVIWTAEGFDNGREAGIGFSYLSPDGEEGFPGNLRIRAEYALNEANELRFEYWAETDRATPVNLTNHAYWNLAGAGSGDVLGHELMLACPDYLVVDDEMIPTGEIRGVQGTPFDFTRAKTIGRDIGQVPGGYDHCWRAKSAGTELKLLAQVHEPTSGRKMEVRTSKPGVQCYTGNFLNGVRGAGGAVFNLHGAFTLETQFDPDCVNRPNFTDCILRPGQTYHHTTVHRFFTD